MLRVAFIYFIFYYVTHEIYQKRPKAIWIVAVVFVCHVNRNRMLKHTIANFSHSQLSLQKGTEEQKK